MNGINNFNDPKMTFCVNKVLAEVEPYLGSIDPIVGRSNETVLSCDLLIDTKLYRLCKNSSQPQTDDLSAHIWYSR